MAVVPIRAGTPLDTAPHSVEAEQAVLGILLMSPDAYDRIAPRLRGDQMYRADHRIILDCLADMLEDGAPVDIVTVHDRLREIGRAEDAGGLAYLGTLAQAAPASANLHRYAQIIRDHAVRRSIMLIAADLAEAAQSRTDARPPADLIEHAAEAIHALAVPERSSEDVSMAEAVAMAEEVEARGERGLETGLPNLDRLIQRSLVPGGYAILAGRPSMGKSALALQIAEHVARERWVAYFSLEMSPASLAQRSRLAACRDMGDPSMARDHLRSLKMRIDYTPRLGLALLRSRLRRIERLYGRVGLIVIDYIGLMSMPRAENANHELGKLSGELKAIAVDVGCPLIALSQLSRAPHSRADHRPQLSDLRDSGALEQDADVVIFAHREEYYRPDDETVRGQAEIMVAKQRSGTTGTAWMRWEPDVTRFRPSVAPLAAERTTATRQRYTPRRTQSD